MGITGLLSVLKSVQNHTHLQRFAGQTIGVDTYGWLHRGTVTCAMELALNKPCTKYVEYAMHRVRMLIHFGITPYLVFDGDNLPSKAPTEAARAKLREESKRRGLELYKARKISLAYPEFQKAVDVTPYMARQLIEELKKMNIKYIVAPYEADAQLAYLEKKGIIDGILSEDSDLLVYGAKKLITKLDQYGDCIEIKRSDFAACRDMSLAGFTDHEFRRMAILSGCDYLANINKLGLKTAHTYVRKYKNIEKILRILQYEQKFTVPNGYLEQFYEAERTFLHHRVFCPLERKLVHFSEPKENMKEEGMPYLGPDLSPSIAIGVACGDLDPMSKCQITPSQITLARSMPNLHHRQAHPSASELKPSKSIDTFFKAKRQPLAELDPNSLTPSPSQRRLLEIHGDASWEARPVSSAPQPRRSTQTPGQNRSIERSAFLERAATLSNFQPAKRTRLCSDTETSTGGKDGRSPFFASHPEESPSIRKNVRTKKARRSDIEIFSDDSVGDIFHEIQGSGPSVMSAFIAPDAQQNAPEKDTDVRRTVSETLVKEVCGTPTRQKIQVQQVEGEQTKSSGSTTKDDNPEYLQDLSGLHTSKVNNLQNSFAYQSSERQATGLSKLGSSDETSRNVKIEDLKTRGRSNQEGTLEYTREAMTGQESGRPKSLRRTFSGQSTSRQMSALRSLGEVQSSAQKVEVGLMALKSVPSLDGEKRPMTPLERLGHRALKQASRTAHSGEPVAPVSTSVVNSASLDDHAAVDQIAKGSEVKVGGGEESVVPNSEDEGSVLADVDKASPVKPNIDLGRFVFSTLA